MHGGLHGACGDAQGRCLRRYEKELSMAACVICGIDDLENGYLTRTAAALAHRCGLPLVIAHVEAPPPTMPVPMLPGVPIERRGLDDSVLTEVRARLEDLARRESASATTLPLLGEPGSQLSRAAEAHDALSVVVGASCRSALGRLVMGSTAAWLCAHGRHPVVMVPRAGSEGGESVSLDGAGGTVLVGVDHESDAAVAIAGAMAERLALDCVLVHVLSVADEDLGTVGLEDELLATNRRSGARLLQRAAMRLPHPERAKWRLLVGEPAEQLAAAASEEGASMVCVASRGRGELRTTLFGSVSEDLCRMAARPVLVIPPGARDAERIAVRRS